MNPLDEMAEAIASTSGCFPFAAREEGRLILGHLAARGITLTETELPQEAPTRKDGPSASELAAMSITNMPARYSAVLQVAACFYGPFTYDDLCALYPHRASVDELPKQTPSSIRSRCAKLRDAGWIVKVDDEGTSDNGRPCQRWQLTRSEAVAA